MTGTGGTRVTLAKRIAWVCYLAGLVVCFDVIAGRLFPAASRSFRRPHPVYHHDLVPSTRATAAWGRRHYPFATNSLGFRDGTVRNRDLATTKHRILFMGDSFVEGVGVTYEESWVGRVEQALGTLDYDVLNAGVIGYSTKLYLLKTRFLLDQKKLRFDEVIVFVDLSDPMEDLFMYQDFVPQPSDAPGWSLASLTRLLRDHSFLFRAVEARLRRQAVFSEDVNLFLPRAEREDHDAKLGGVLDHGGAAWLEDPAVFERYGAQGLELSGASMAALCDLCARRGIRVTIAVYPWPLQIFRKSPGGVPVAFWSAFAAEHGAGFIDLFPLFVNDAAGFDTTYAKYFIDGDVHWNAEGHRLVAEKVAAYLRSRP